MLPLLALSLDPQAFALYQLYSFTKGTSWFNQRNWTSVDPCNRHGVTCLAGAVTRLELPDNNLQGELPALDGLSKLEVLDLSSNRLFGNFGKALNSVARSLRHLRLWQTKFSQLPDVPNRLETIVVFNNVGLGGKLPAAFFNSTTLEYLDLTINQFSGTIPETLSKATKLRDCRLGENRLTGTIPEFSSQALVQLLLHKNQFEGTVGGWIFTKPLAMLTLNYNKLTAIAPWSQGSPHFPNTSITTIKLSHNNIRSLPQGYNTFPVSTLEVSDNFELQGSVLDLIGPGSSLTLLNVSSTSLNFDWCNTSTVELPSIMFLYARNCSLSYSVKTILQCVQSPRLIDLDFASNNLFGSLREVALPEPLPALYLLDVSHNPFIHGFEPAFVSSYSIGLMDVVLTNTSCNWNLNSKVFRAFVEPDYPRQEVDFSTNLRCFQLRHRFSGTRLYHSPKFTDYNFCECDNKTQYWSSATGRCLSCPDFVTCYPGVDPNYTLTFVKGRYPLLNGQLHPLIDGTEIGALQLPKCVHESACGNGSTTFSCRKGYEGLLCAKCVQGFYPVGEDCFECSLHWQWISTSLVLIVLIVLILMVIRTIKRPKNLRTAEITINYLQVNLALADAYHRGNRSVETAALFLQFRCWGALQNPLTPFLFFVPGFLLACYLIVVATRFCGAGEKKLEDFLWVVTYLCFFPGLQHSFSLIFCKSDQDLEYNFGAPWMRCSDTVELRVLGCFGVGYTAVMYIAFLIGTCLEKSLGQNSFLFLRAGLKHKLWWWRAVCVTLRKVCLTIAFQQGFQAMISIILLSDLVGQLTMNPFENFTDNVLASLSALALVLIDTVFQTLGGQPLVYLNWLSNALILVCASVIWSFEGYHRSRVFLTKWLVEPSVKYFKKEPEADLEYHQIRLEPSGRRDSL